MIGMTHRNRIVFSSLLLLLFAQIIFGIYGYAKINDIRVSSIDFRNTYMAKQLEYNALSVFKQVDTYAAKIKTQEFSFYSSRFLNLESAAEVEKAERELNDKLDSLQINADLLQGVYLIGADAKQKNYVKLFEGEPGDSGMLPWMEDLNGSGVMEAIAIKGIGIPIFIQEGELQQVVHAKWSYISDIQLQRVRAFVRELEGKWIINNGINDYTLSILVLNENYPRQFLHGSDLEGYALSVYTADGFAAWGEPQLNLNGEFLSQEERKSWTLLAGEESRSHYIKQLSPYNISLVLTDTRTGWSEKFSHTLLVMVFLYAVLIIGNLILSISLANKILSPLMKLTSFIRNQGGMLPLGSYPQPSSDRKLFRSTSARTKLFALFLLTVVVPLICIVSIFSILQDQYAKEEWKNTIETVSKQISWAVYKQAELYEGAAHALSVNDHLKSYLSSPSGNLPSTVTSLSSQQATTIYPESRDIAYFVLYDTNGNAVYSTYFSNNLSLFYLDRYDYEAEDMPDIVWLPEAPDVFNHLATQLIKRVYHIDKGGTKTIIGYLQMVLKPDAFQAVTIQDELMAQITVEQGNYLAHASPTVNMAGNDLTVEERIPGFDWIMTVRFPIKDMSGWSEELIWVVASVILLCFLIGLMLSHWLIRPIGLLRNAMDHVNEANYELDSTRRTRDEVSLLAHHFNRMVEKMNQLVEEDFRSKLREKELNALRTQAEMSMLQQQINPHFLYNTLESINMEAQRNNDSLVSKMISSLANLFRYSIRTGPEQTVPLETEIEYTRYYVTIQETRFKGRFAVEWQIHSDTLQCKMLKFMLQPIVENAIHHGLSEYSSGGELIIASHYQEGRLLIQIKDNGIGMRAQQLEELRLKLSKGVAEESPLPSSIIHRGVGLANVYKRLKIYYGEEADLTIDSKYMKGTTVTISIPNLH